MKSKVDDDNTVFIITVIANLGFKINLRIYMAEKGYLKNIPSLVIKSTKTRFYF